MPNDRASGSIDYACAGSAPPFAMPPRGKARERSVPDCFADLIGAIGSDGFPCRFLKTMQVLADVELCSVFQRSPAESVRLLFAEGDQPHNADFPFRASLDYARTHWRSDHQISQLSRSGRKAPIVVRKCAAEIADPAYRNACYERAGIIERVSIFWPGPPTLVANGYRTAQNPPFSAADIDRLEHHAGLLMAAVDRHRQASASAGPMFNEPDLVQSLMALHCRLSMREAEISAAMILGETQEEIACRKRLSHGSVVTYRRRAYSKLGVANRRDLLRLYRRMATGEMPIHE